MRLAALSLMLFLSAGYPVASERCEYPDVFASTFAPPFNQVGEFRIELRPPDYRNPASVQHHLVFATVWGRLLSSELPHHGAGKCRALTGSWMFPDLRVLLAEKPLPGNDKEADSSDCISALRAMLQNAHPGKQEIEQAFSLEARRLSPRGSDVVGAATHTGNILRSALREIYDFGTVMHALVSTGPGTFEGLDAGAFLAWLERQRSAGAMKLTPLRFCGPEIDPTLPTGTGAARLPYSGTVAPGALTLTMGARVPASARLPRHVVIVGKDPVVGFSQSADAALGKYCNQQHTFVIDQGLPSEVTATVRIQCWRSLFYEDSWTAFFCDPSDCTSARLTEIAMQRIANDPDVTAMAKNTTVNGRNRGPYLVNVKTAHE